MLNFTYRAIVVIFILLSASVSNGQETKVVVIPLGGDTISQCEVTTACDGNQATVKCPGGEEIIPCTAPKRVFVTSELYNGNLGGLDGADANCQRLAVNAGFNGEFRAWISDSTGSPSTRFTQSTTPYVSLNGLVIAQDYADLTDGVIQSPICINEMGSDDICGSDSLKLAWTNTTAQGTPNDAELVASCADWAEASGLARGQGGDNNALDFTWSEFPQAGGISCLAEFSLYCFEQ
jgi:hypothetical protein